MDRNYLPLILVHGILSARFYARQKPISMENSMHTEHQNRSTRTALDQAGFTLLEIIAVLVIMSILAVVAVPKYFDLQNQAREKAMGTGIAEAVGRLNGHFAQNILSNVPPASIVYTPATLGTDLGDFELIRVEESTENGITYLTLAVEGKINTPVAGLSTRQRVPRPGL